MLANAIPPFKFHLLAAGIGIVVGTAAFIADDIHGLMGAILMGIVSSASTWMLGATFIGALARNPPAGAVSAGVFGAGVTVTYYTLRWFVLRPWTFSAPDISAATWNSPQGIKFLLIAAVWVIGTTIGAATLGALANRLLRRKSPPRRDLWNGVWLGTCLAPALAYLPELVTNAVAAASWTGLDADTGGLFVLTSTITSGLLVAVTVTWWATRSPGISSWWRFAGVAVATALVLAVLFRLASDLFLAVTALL
ncbi:hypothetical protein E4U02_14895 [Microbacterium paludicola]|uniref:Uncharacterized protein n=1 Tax=Microbacterium paludicola TaxID=300019 RepID=A0A4Y9FLZ8_9MICO|nr:hypothetical protein [Microbacterium paludicola]MBF0817691.1 hypothetical protein [Microbacterium paludicola]TFU30224.1 hypothetical protein E4U02_14895 [Microbacterium paludicola]